MSKSLEIRPIRHKGRGVFATACLEKGTVLDETPVLVFPNGQATARSVIHRYTFAWTPRHAALALGVMAFANHAYDPNTAYTFLPRSQRIRFRTRRPILGGEEITINYNGDPIDPTPVGFRVR